MQAMPAIFLLRIQLTPITAKLSFQSCHLLRTFYKSIIPQKKSLLNNLHRSLILSSMMPLCGISNQDENAVLGLAMLVPEVLLTLSPL